MYQSSSHTETPPGIHAQKILVVQLNAGLIRESVP